MNDCCSNNEDKASANTALPRKFNCPANDQLYIEVEKKTILQHIISPWEKPLTEEKYYFCEDPNCDVVYFGLNSSVIKQHELRTQVGKKSYSNDALICYCFGVSKSQAKEDSNIKQYVTEQTKNHNCSCEVKNPSGRCCLKDFPKNIN